ncbi:4-alpha-glucanotransferase [Chitinispirillales bacterium ANBcel5]|uniref:4-alpha-glucanotransferase n=1 Tax=Cellulosispirillum alkaliphilum TaxID=3039283 RepID=UPI002A54380E|nr:4-alpha-glucanotransferase [Chitinispirillales bacterium ANBcel5]
MRASGIFLHPTSLPSPYGIGDLGADARWWIDLLKNNYQSFWQICPLGPTGFGDSPYQTLCSFAGNTLLLSPDLLKEQNLLSDSDLSSFPKLSEEKVDFGTVIKEKEKLFRIAFQNFSDVPEFSVFCQEQHWWLHDYALFRVIKDNHDGKPWWQWNEKYRLRDKDALENVAQECSEQIRYYKFLQFVFNNQWLSLKAYANEKRVRIVGDIPYYTAYDSSDTWSQPELFEIGKDGGLLRVAGVPPDYFSETGQLWGNPLYKWDVMKNNNYSWWAKRLGKMLQWVDLIRLDHFRAFESYWAIPVQSQTAINGVWEKGPGIHFFECMKEQLGDLPFIAEDLGDITPEVLALREQIGAPGMKILQFAFDGNPLNPYLPYNVCFDSVTYTGTHDNDTSLGWYINLPSIDKKRVRDYLGCTNKSFLKSFLRCAFASPSELCIVPFQDVLMLDSAHRMNTPGTQSGNWSWRFTKNMVEESMLKRIYDYTLIYGRAGNSGHCL